MANVISNKLLDWQDQVHGAVELAEVESFERSSAESATVQFSVTGEPIGAMFAPGEITISLTERVSIENPVDWELLRTRKLTGLLTVTDLGADGQEGTRSSYKCVVSSVSETGNNQGENTRTIELKAGRRARQR